jgi:hypothetical protein
MSFLESLFNQAPRGGVAENPVVKFDYKTQHLRVRLTTDFLKLKGPLVRHWVDTIGWVTCGQEPYRKKDGTFGIWGDCVFCQERKALKENMQAQAIAMGLKEMSKEDAKTANALHRRKFEMIGVGEIEVKEKKKVVSECAPGAISFNVLDMFFPQQNQQYKTLFSIFENKGTLCDYWLAVAGNGQIMLDDKVTAEEKARDKDVDVDLSFFDQTKDYSVGSAEYLKKSSAAGEATPMDEEEAPKPKKAKLAPVPDVEDDDKDDTIPF